jgi:hypothetical protein
MSKFACPHCSQHIECDDQYAGMQIKCPACQVEMVIPPLQAAPAPAVAPVSNPVRPVLRTAPTPPPASRPALPPRPVPMAAASKPEETQSGKAKKIATIAAAVILVPAALYFGISWAVRAQAKWNEARARDQDPGVLGGQMSHMAELNRVLDATDPAKYSKDTSRGTESDRPLGGKLPRNRSVAVGGKAAPDTGPEIENLPVLPARWTLELNAAQIPGGKANGLISGSNFVVEAAWLFTGGPSQILSLRQGSTLSPDNELLVYLRLKPGEKLEGKTWTVTRDQTAGVPQIMKRWKTNPRVAPQQKSFAKGYAMRLELGQMADGILPGKIFVALPDPEQSVVAGLFQATVRVAGSASAKGQPSGAPMTLSEE